MDEEKKIFLSYSHKDMDLANEIDSALRIKGIKLTRDKRDLKSSIKEFMKTIRDHDLVLMLISDPYLKSKNCMFEAIEFIKESDYKQRIIPIVIDDVDFDMEETYLQYWEKIEESIERRIKKHGSGELKSLQEKKEEINEIEANIIDFIATIKDLIYIRSTELLDKGYKKLYERIGLEVDESKGISYDVISQHDVSTGVARRCSMNILINRDYPKCDVKDSLKEIVFFLKPDNDVIWIFVYNSSDDIPKTNWFCEGYWVSPNLDQKWHPMKMKSNDQIEDIEIIWNDEYESRQEIYKSYSGTKNELIEFSDSLLKQIVPIAKTAIEKFDKFQNGKISENEFLDYMHNNRQIESELYSQSGEGKFATYECQDYIQKFDNLFAIVDNMFLYYSIEFMDTWSSENKKIMMNRDKDSFYKELNELYYERKKLK